MKQQIQSIVDENSYSYKSIIREQYSQVYEEINKIEGNNFAERLYRFLNDIKSQPVCNHKNCNEEVGFISINEGYNKYCSKSCSSSGRFDEDKDLIKKLSDQAKNRWKKGVYDDEDTRSGMGWFEGKSHSEEHKEKMSEKMTGREVTWNDKIKENHWANSDKKQQVIEKIRQSKEESEKWKPKKHVKSLIEWCMNNPEKAWSNRKYKSGWYTSNKTGDEEFYHSGYEKVYMERLDEKEKVLHWTKDHGIRIDYQYEGQNKTYIPDFLVETEDGEFLIETKGWVRDEEKHKAKINAAETYCNSENIEYKVIYQNEQ